MKLAQSFTPELNSFSREWNERDIIAWRSEVERVVLNALVTSGGEAAFI